MYYCKDMTWNILKNALVQSENFTTDLFYACDIQFSCSIKPFTVFSAICTRTHTITHTYTRATLEEK